MTFVDCPPSVVRPLYKDTLRLRNVTAHGHYVAWKHVRKTLSLLQCFDTST